MTDAEIRQQTITRFRAAAVAVQTFCDALLATIEPAALHGDEHHMLLGAVERLRAAAGLLVMPLPMVEHRSAVEVWTDDGDGDLAG